MAANAMATFIDSTNQIPSLIHQILELPASPPTLYIDIEGIDLCRDGSISLLTLLLYRDEFRKQIFLIDIHTLGSEAFDTPGESGNTLRYTLESPTITKVFFDVRNDSDALHAHFGIKLENIEDVQLMENASRPRSKRLLNGLTRCIEDDAQISETEKRNWKLIKEHGERLFKARFGGSDEVFNERPLLGQIQAYCIGDVQYLPLLRNMYWNRLTTDWKSKVALETRNRVAESQRPDYQPNGREMALGPWPEEQRRRLLEVRLNEMN